MATSRRSFLAGAAATTLLAACSSSDDSDGSEGAGGDGGSDSAGSDDVLSVVRFFGPYFAAGQIARVPFGLSDSQGLLPADAVPANVSLDVRNPEGEVVAEGLTSIRHAEGLPRPYYVFEFTPASEGFYDFTLDVDGEEVISQFEVVAPDAPGMEQLVGPGDPLPPIETPTVDEARGVTPICTREPACDLHAQTVAQALEAGGPVALLVATPAFCQTVVCGPILDILLDQIGEYPDVTFVHAEVYRNPEENQTPPVPDDFAPVIDALGLPFEPVLYVTGTDGVVRQRLDYIFDGEEIRDAIDRALA